ncbi:unnamed protein product [Pleuronectes platessa]|uniref:Uncharacterized protein n=1 Tax=Pleuronectes platessa TaxID=8262 RepID=A0A9N7YVY5_PLEPL|nr:unnamed protein product [Pleuronectes platessa]
MVLLICDDAPEEKEPLIWRRSGHPGEHRPLRRQRAAARDTEAFDIGTLRNLNVIRDPPCGGRHADTPTFFHYSSALARPISPCQTMWCSEFIWDAEDADVDRRPPRTIPADVRVRGQRLGSGVTELTGVAK